MGEGEGRQSEETTEAERVRCDYLGLAERGRAERFTRAVRGAVMKCSSLVSWKLVRNETAGQGCVGLLDDDIVLDRVRLPPRARGAGLRSQAWLSPVAFVACFIDRVRAARSASST